MFGREGIEVRLDNKYVGGMAYTPKKDYNSSGEEL